MSILQQTGFLNREELHNADLEAIQKADRDRENKNENKNASASADTTSSGIGFFKIGRWVWDHNPEVYARENYTACLAHLIEGEGEGDGPGNGSGKLFKNTNVPPGHVYRPWSLESETKRMQAGIKSDLKRNGDWSV